MDVSSPSDATVNCTFLSGFIGTSRCTVQYGTDRTYLELPYSAESTETGTAGETVSVVLREQLNSSSVYYYTVSAVSGDVTVRVLVEPFTTPLYSKQCFYVLFLANCIHCLKVLNMAHRCIPPAIEVRELSA